MKKVICYLLISSFLSCSNNTFDEKNFIVTTLKEVDSSYKYTPGKMIAFKGKYYFPLKSATYSNGFLQRISFFKSEGEVDYSYADLKKDKLLLEAINDSLNASLSLHKDYVKFNNLNIPIVERKKDTIYVYDNSKKLMLRINGK